MTEIYLVRHGQASFGQDNYDVLSELGQQQARWLGEWIAQQPVEFDAIYSGTLERQRHTLEYISAGITPARRTQMTEFDEFDFTRLIQAFLQQNPEHNVAEPTPRFWFKTLRKSMQAWSQGELDVPHDAESWPHFIQRVRNGLNHCLTDNNRKVLISTSGGVIACAVGLTLGLTAESIIKLNLQIQNTSITRLICSANNNWSLHSFNNLPHLSSRERAEHITYA